MQRHVYVRAEMCYRTSPEDSSRALWVLFGEMACAMVPVLAKSPIIPLTPSLDYVNLGSRTYSRNRGKPSAALVAHAITASMLYGLAVKVLEDTCDLVNLLNE